MREFFFPSMKNQEVVKVKKMFTDNDINSLYQVEPNAGRMAHKRKQNITKHVNRVNK